MKIEQTFIAITLDDGHLVVMGFVIAGRGSSLPHGADWIEEGWWLREATDENIFDEISRTAFPDDRQPVSYRRILPGDVPQDRTYRNAWRDDGQKISHDMVKARAIHRDRLRQMRADEFTQNDLALRDAMLVNDASAILASTERRDALRDVTADPRIEAAQTIEELKAAIPDILIGEKD